MFFYVFSLLTSQTARCCQAPKIALLYAAVGYTNILERRIEERVHPLVCSLSMQNTKTLILDDDGEKIR